MGLGCRLTEEPKKLTVQEALTKVYHFVDKFIYLHNAAANKTFPAFISVSSENQTDNK